MGSLKRLAAEGGGGYVLIFVRTTLHQFPNYQCSKTGLRAWLPCDSEV
jgi:hypothetical protein